MNRPELSFLICTQARSGSWYLAETLELTGVAGRPREYFNPKFEAEWAPSWGASNDHEYLDAVFEQGTTSNGIFGAKLLQSQFMPLLTRLRSVAGNADFTGFQAMHQIFPNLKYIYLTRCDKVRQAVSHFRAIQTGIWWKLGGGTDLTESDPPPSMPDFARIYELEQRAWSNDQKWEDYFKENEIEPIRVIYENLCQDLEATILSVLQELGANHPGGLTIQQPRFQKQSDATSEAWVEKYLSYKNNHTLFDGTC